MDQQQQHTLSGCVPQHGVCHRSDKRPYAWRDHSGNMEARRSGIAVLINSHLQRSTLRRPVFFTSNSYKSEEYEQRTRQTVPACRRHGDVYGDLYTSWLKSSILVHGTNIGREGRGHR